MADSAQQSPAGLAPTPDGADSAQQQSSADMRRALLEAGRTEFANYGFDGARLERIVAKVGCAKRMLYYYFGNKKDVYLAVIAQCYSDIRASEEQLNLDALAPLQALHALAVKKVGQLTLEHFRQMGGDDRAGIVRGLAGIVVVVEQRALVEERGLGRVEVLRAVVLLQHAAAEGDHAAAAVVDREHDAVAEFVVDPAGVVAHAVDFFGGDFWLGVGQGKNQRLGCHGGYHGGLEYASG